MTFNFSAPSLAPKSSLRVTSSEELPSPLPSCEDFYPTPPPPPGSRPLPVLALLSVDNFSHPGPVTPLDGIDPCVRPFFSPLGFGIEWLIYSFSDSPPNQRENPLLPSEPESYRSRVRWLRDRGYLTTLRPLVVVAIFCSSSVSSSSPLSLLGNAVDACSGHPRLSYSVPV